MVILIKLLRKEMYLLIALKEIKKLIETQLKNSDSDNFVWNSKQAYIAFGVGLVAAAEKEIDSTPMEVFDKDLLMIY